MSVPDELSGRRFGPYELISPLGAGGMATVYKAFHPAMNRHVALKILPRHLAGEASFMERFQREAQLVAQLQHPHILPVFDFGLSEGYAYIVMPMVTGGTLIDLMERGPVPLEQALLLAEEIADALDYAHQRGLIHRDVKPGNVLMDERGHCLLTDFGLAKIRQTQDAGLTMSGTILGTPAYMSPEQGNGLPLDGRSDVYSLGIILYELVTGRPPYRAETPLAVMLKHVSEPTPPPTLINKTLPSVVEEVVMRALAKRPEDRYATAGDLMRALRHARENLRATMAGPVVAQPVPGATRVPWWGVAGVGLVVLAVVVGAIGWRMANVAAPVPTPTPTLNTPITPATQAPVQPSATLPPLVFTATPAPAQTDTPPPIATTSVPASAGPLTETSSVDGAVLIFVPAGPFLRGADAQDINALPAEKPQQSITLDAFWIDQTEVTNAQYTLCVQAGACTPPTSRQSSTRSAYYDAPQFANYPVIYISWGDARRYCAWAGRRLPSEAEWEKAARGDTGFRYPWGNELPSLSRSNFNNSVGDTSAVGAYPSGASPLGTWDMAGNVMEWVNDWYSGPYYATSPLVNPTGPDRSALGHSVRGGAWNSGAVEVRLTHRRAFAETARQNFIGFRCAR